MRSYNKKGISPLIATVLLIGFTVALGVLFYLWLSGTLSLQAKKGEQQCSSDDIAGLDFTVPTCTFDATKKELVLKVSNQGNKRIDGFWVAMSPIGLTPLDVHNINPGKEADLGFNLKDQTDPVSVTDVELIPVVIQDSNVKTCSSNSVKVQCTSS